MVEHDNQTDLATAFEQRFGNLAVDLADLREVDAMPVFVKGIGSVENLITIDRDIALAVVGSNRLADAASQIGPRDSEIFDTMVKVFGERATDPFAAITGFTIQEVTGNARRGNFHYLTGFKVISPDTDNQLIFTADHYLSYWSSANCFTQLRSGMYMPRPGVKAVLDGIEKQLKKRNGFEQENMSLIRELT